MVAGQTGYRLLAPVSAEEEFNTEAGSASIPGEFCLFLQTVIIESDLRQRAPSMSGQQTASAIISRLKLYI